MKIQAFSPAENYLLKKQRDEKKEVNKKLEKGDGYIPSNKENITYGKPAKYDQVSIQRLKNESEKAYETLRRIVSELIRGQGRGDGQIKAAEEESLRNDAARLIADDGPLGAEAVSNRIVEFAVAISGGDKSKLDELKAAIKEGFRQVEELLGGLPEVSQKTYGLIMEKLDKWEQNI
ncbi:hypothetical protein [Desulfitibacter alkalitolerans]|uniref:hypothetical protein n=1 Tax=Desulfitibacter alkalitolerans TaxID=264641 RepID=UPI00048288E0|nr:hypothetical protein [Desulfitibacter alkalitolerans]